MNTCDYGHQTKQEIRRLPIGPHGNILVCKNHHADSLEFMRRKNRYLEDENKYDLPAWEDLKVYSEETK